MNAYIHYKYGSIKCISDEKTHLPLKGEGTGEVSRIYFIFDHSKISWALQPTLNLMWPLGAP